MGELKVEKGGDRMKKPAGVKRLLKETGGSKIPEGANHVRMRETSSLNLCELNSPFIL